LTGKADFTPEEWKLILEGPPTAGLIVSTAQRGGTFREAISIAKAYTEARKQHGASELLDEIISARPQLDRSRQHSVEELREHALQLLRDAVAAVEAKAAREEVEAYRGFVVAVAERVAGAKKEGEESTSDAEQAAIAEIADAVGKS
jgi:hypothetical protein